ncbi:hypothetical protein HDU82_005669 [Entophlyctis luteolus]|nr:hypothetical protein HDU82_005669 [Entophlyctis luteolus]KAJ3389182.1 hypothetical protein HDU84_009089 [Entophlyctis sp. JEL0112]
MRIVAFLAVLATLAGLLICGWNLAKDLFSIARTNKLNRRRQLRAVVEEATTDDYLATLQNPSKVERFLGSSISRGKNCKPKNSVMFDDNDFEEKFENAGQVQGSVVPMGSVVAKLYEAVLQ